MFTVKISLSQDLVKCMCMNLLGLYVVTLSTQMYSAICMHKEVKTPDLIFAHLLVT